jgi:hypothetical protein
MATGVGCYMDRRYDLVGRQVDLLHGSPPVARHIGEFLIGCDRDLDRSRPGGNFRDDGQFLCVDDGNDVRVMAGDIDTRPVPRCPSAQRHGAKK